MKNVLFMKRNYIITTINRSLVRTSLISSASYNHKNVKNLGQR